VPVVSFSFTCRACVPEHEPPFLIRRIRKLWLEPSALRPDRIKGCPTVPAAPAAAAVSLYLPRRRTLSAGDRSRSTPFVVYEKKQHRNSFCCHPRYPLSCRRARAYSNHCETRRLLLLPAHPVVTCCAACSCHAPSCRSQQQQRTAGDGNKAATQDDDDQTTDSRGRAQRSKVRADKHAPAAAGEMSVSSSLPAAGTSTDLDRRQRRPSGELLSALRLSHADRSQFFTEVATV
jgi:hypothetical protein